MARKVVKAKDVVFATLVHNEDMTVVAEQGVVLLQSNETGEPYMLPPGLVLPAQAYGQECSVTVRDLTKEVVLNPGEDDIFEEDLSKKGNEKVMPVDHWNDILTLMDELKLESITRSLTSAGTVVSGVLLCGVATWLYAETEFAFTPLCILGIIGGFLAVVFSVYSLVKNFGSADSKIIQDSAGNYINLDTGKTNMNGGMKIPIKQ